MITTCQSDNIIFGTWIVSSPPAEVDVTVLHCRWIMYVQPVTRVLTKKTLLFSDARSKVWLHMRSRTKKCATGGERILSKKPREHFILIIFTFRSSIVLFSSYQNPLLFFNSFSLYDLLLHFQWNFFTPS